MKQNLVYKYYPKEIEVKWQKEWAKNKIYQSKQFSDKSKKKFYILVEFTYPSGDLHMGHWFTFTMPDVLARKKRMQGFNVFFPNGFDAFGLPAENAAIKRSIHPQDWTYQNIKKMKAQFQTMGASYDWSHEVITCDPKYYKWNQWIFLKMLEKNLVYKKAFLSNWCPSCKTVLANENVESGNCWRCGNEVIQKEVMQWFLKITAYANKLIWQDKNKTAWPASLKHAQNNWIGKTSGAIISFRLKGGRVNELIQVYTTKPETIYGVTFIVLAPEHPLVGSLITPEQKQKVEVYLQDIQKKSELIRKEEREKKGIFLGSYAINPLSGEEIPIWVGNYVLSTYGKGAIMAVPAHDDRDNQFAKAYQLPIKQVVVNKGPADSYSDDDIIMNSDAFTGATVKNMRAALLKEKRFKSSISLSQSFHLHDWSISRQRYWGTPIPIINCIKCGIVPVPEKDLPVQLPYKVDYTPKGKSPLATASDWVTVNCPKCGAVAKRDTETMDTFFDSSWYFFRYISPNLENKIFDKQLAKKLLPVDIYFGGAEHSLGHTLYSRFFTKFFKDIGLTNLSEYAKQRVHHGIILGPDGSRMSKSKGNVVNPDEQVSLFGSDTVRLYLAFLGPYDIVTPWSSDSVMGMSHFLKRVWNLKTKLAKKVKLSSLDLLWMHKTILKVGNDIDNIKFNTAVAALMEWLNYLNAKESISPKEYRVFLLLLAPFAPHITEELWQLIYQTKNGKYISIHEQRWPRGDKRYINSDIVKVIVQVNGKMRDIYTIHKKELKDFMAVQENILKSKKIANHIGGRKITKIIRVKENIINILIEG